MKTSSRRSSGMVVSSISCSIASGTASRRVLASSVRSRRSRSMARLRAVVVSHAPGLRGRTLARPALGGDREGLLSGLLGEVEVAEEADQGGDHAAPLVAEGLLDQGAGSTSGRTSTQPPRRAAGMRAAKSRARVEVVGLEQVEAAEDLLGVRERAVGDQRSLVVHANGRRGLDALQLRAADDARVTRERQVLGRHRPALFVAERVVGARPLVDQHGVAHQAGRL